LVLLLLAEGSARLWLYEFAPAESYVRYAVPSEFPVAAKYAPHHYLCYTLQPGYHKLETNHNSLGLRGPEVRQPKPAGTFRIVVLGGSTTYGEFISSDDETFPAQMQSSLRQFPGHENVEVVNAGVPGYTSWESIAHLAYRLVDLSPDLVIAYEGVNDVHARLVHPRSFRGDNAGRRMIWNDPIEVRLCRYSVLSRVLGYHLGLWRLPGVDSFVQAPTSDPGTHGPSAAIGGDPMDVLNQNPPTYTARNLRTIAGIARAHGSQVMFATWAYSPLKGDYAATPHYQRGFAEHNAVVEQVSQELDVPCFSFANQMPTAPDHWRDGRHVNEKGARLQGALFARFLLDEGLLRHRGSLPTSPPAKEFSLPRTN
jgi:lysophospholipase L1-like esterase